MNLSISASTTTDPRLTPEDLCINRLAESDRCAENFAGKPVPSAEDINTNLSFVPIPPPVWRAASSLAAVNASAPKRSTRSLVAYFGCDLHNSVAFLLTPCSNPKRGYMAAYRKNTPERIGRKSQALRMMWTSGVIRSAASDPPCITNPQPMPCSLRNLPREKFVYARPIHVVEHSHHTSMFAHWHTTFIDILKEFGRK